MSGALRGLLALACGLTATGCVAVAWGRYPVPTNVAVEELGPNRWRVKTPEVDATVELYWYNPHVMFIGLVVPIVPIVPFSDTDTLKVDVEARSSSGALLFRSDEARLVFRDQNREPVVAKILHQVGVDAERAYFVFDGPPPREPFSLVIEGLPRLDLELRYRFNAAVGTPGP